MTVEVDRPDRPELAVWLESLEGSYADYTPPPEAIGMTTRYELSFVEAYARDLFTGAGRIVDLGCWYGATTAALARGLSDNGRVSTNRLVEAYDLFVWEQWMTRHDHRVEHLGKRYAVGDSFMADVEALLAPYRDVVRLERRDLTEPSTDAAPIEFLFVDAMKSWTLGRSIVGSFFPRLIPGVSFVVQQDFVWYHPSIVSAHLLMWHLRDHFEFVHHVPRSCSSVFRCTAPVELTEPLPSPGDFTVDMIDEAYEYSIGCARPERIDYVRAGKLFFLLDREFAAAALEEARSLFAPDRKVAADLVAGVAGLTGSYRDRAAKRDGEGRDEAVQAIEAIGALAASKQ